MQSNLIQKIYNFDGENAVHKHSGFFNGILGQTHTHTHTHTKTAPLAKSKHTRK